ncbi:MAG: ABC transporter ATP-binding protein [Clostridia bacterium]|nr:ABC transporter ATP-binding protein [Clostridia bacterium]
MYAVKTEGLTKYYGDVCGIKNIDLCVEQGDFFGFIGPNGAGKSTTIRTLLGFISQTAGKAEILGMDTLSQRTEILKNVGYLPSEASFYNGMRVRDIIKLSASLRKLDCEKEAKILCKRLELDTDKKVNELSLGNRKKVGIVCALQHKPSLYILDEATSGLDPLMQREFFDILGERNRDGATVFLSSHVLSEIGRYCKTAAIIRNGEILVCKSVSELSHTGVKRVTLRGVIGEIAIDGARDIRYEGDTAGFLYSGSAESLVKRLTTLKFDDISITDPEPDEIFLHYYAREDE